MLPVVFSSSVGLAQWIVLRRWVHQASWWIFANVAGYILACIAEGFWYILPLREIGFFGLRSSLVIGSVTGVFMLLLLRLRRKNLVGN